MTTKTAGRVVGALLLSAFFLYGGGSFLVASTVDSGDAFPENAASLSQLAAGSALLLLNSVAVAVIGALASRVLRRRHHRTARLYLATRTVEAVLLALAPVGTLTLTLLTTRSGGTANNTGSGLQDLARTAVGTSESAYWLAMATLGVGSVFFCGALLRSALLPRVLAVWGIVGYAIFALGSVLQLLGYGVGLPLSVPGGLFEVTAGSYLLVKGFGAAEAHPAPRTTSIAAPPSHATN
jgi:hypothetical protein